FLGNAAGGWGGGLCNSRNATLTNCTFAGNTSSFFAGAIMNNQGIAVLNNCLFTGNSAATYGGAMFNIGATAALNNCTFSQNWATDGTGGGTYNSSSSCTFNNCVLWANSDEGGMDESAQIDLWRSTAAVDYCCVQGLTGALGGIGNIGSDPLFVDADGADDIPGTGDDETHLRPGSPCVDAGDNTAVAEDSTDLDGDSDTGERIPLDLDGNSRFVDDPHTDDNGIPDPPIYGEIVDMGAYEFFPVLVDVKPGSCPNVLNRGSHGVLPVAIVGTADFDVTGIDVSSIRLWRADGVGGPVAPSDGPPGPHSVFEDVATPFDGQPCECHDLSDDDLDDLSTKFWTEEVVEALELNDLPGGDTVVLVVTGNLLGGTPFEASDCVTVKHGRPRGR
ncbi:MAG: right-handed parallel beta-helix repeat-containing protein, partial [Planctomycetota bacterium]